MYETLVARGSIRSTVDSIVLGVEGLSQAAIDIRGTFTGALDFKGTIDGETYFSIKGQPIPSGSQTSQVSAAGQWLVNCAGLAKIKISTDSFSNGTAIVIMRALAGGGTGGGSLGAEYNATAPTLTDGDSTSLQTDENGNLKVTKATADAGEDLTNNVQGVLTKPVASGTYATTGYQENGSVTKANIKASAGNVYSIRVTNTNAAVRYFQLHNKATAPAAGETAQASYLIPAGTATNPGVLELLSTFFAPSAYFATGIGWAISTTDTTFTDSATASEHKKTVRYV